MTKTTEPKTIEHVDPAQSLPSMHIDHSNVFANEIAVRIGGFDAGLAAIIADMDGMQAAYDAECAKRADEHAAAIEARHRLKRDLDRGRRMALAAQAAYSDPIPADIEQPVETE